MIGHVGALLAERARISPRLEAQSDLTCGESFTFAELNRRCNRVADALAGRLKRGDRLALRREVLEPAA